MGRETDMKSVGLVAVGTIKWACWMVVVRWGSSRCREAVQLVGWGNMAGKAIKLGRRSGSVCTVNDSDSQAHILRYII